MAKMYPAVFDEEFTDSYAERMLYPILRDMPGTDDWHILHSLRIARHPTQSQGEADFVVIIPDHGTLILEVKGGRISHTNGMWYSDNAKGRNIIKNPISEANYAMYAIKEFVQKNGPEKLDQTLFGFGVVFPNCTVHGHLNIPDLDDCQIADADDLSDMKGYLLKLAGYCRSRKTPNITIPHKQQTDALISLLRPIHEFKLSISSQIHNVEHQIIVLTENQRAVFEGQLENERCLTKGSAGTGKTVLAVGCARYFAKQGKRVALFCYNRQLAMWLQERLQDDKEIICDTFLGYMEKTVRNLWPEGAAKKAENPEEYYSRQLPAFFSEYLIDSQAEPFDCIILDEAQDLFKPEFMEALDLMLYGGLESGSWYFFMDAERQNLYLSGLSSEKVSEMLKEYHCFYAKYTLQDNCRNSQAIIEKVDEIFGTHTHFQKMEERGADVVFRTYKKSKDQSEVLEEIIDRLLREGIHPDDIVLLSPTKYDRSVVNGLGSFSFSVSQDRTDRKGQILFSTVHSFKGLESPVVILIDIENLDYDRQKNLLYIGMTRARSALYIITAASAHQKIVQMIRECKDNAK